jgi:hypothetical protein
VVIENSGTMADGAWQVVSADGDVRKAMAGEHFLVSKEMRREISIERNFLPQLQHAPIVANNKSTDTVLILRRLLTEARDRLLVS